MLQKVKYIAEVDGKLIFSCPNCKVSLETTLEFILERHDKYYCEGCGNWFTFLKDITNGKKMKVLSKYLKQLRN